MYTTYAEGKCGIYLRKLKKSIIVDIKELREKTPTELERKA